ncbi:AMP-binding protein [Methylobacterium haplocladii]|uniref:AMP-dependent synthetase/ligase domain-containing protein n=1 Tax=Methylobacterium haplocladii TaxID=1176176 RepID=A0A512IVD7_9HYPH|nr:AMP-binding protein [Methylobacterium haplocladii]GEP01684.1 hypothetical protein MHA02_40710 [Methylobacterium haplocladii]GJD86254.1 hypothetical protein HPGCJGGD_4158 [Methylobacterium haplocladii]
MSAHWVVTEAEALRAPVLAQIGLGALLRLTARRHPDRVALVDPADKPLWSGRPAITWTYAAAAEIVDRLARGLRGWRLPPGSRVGLCLPGSAENALALLAVEAAGHVPCLLPVSWDEDSLVAAVQGAGVSAVLTQARLGTAAPAERLCAVAARYFGLRYVAAFGPDVPDGVINLDRVVLDERAAADEAVPVSPAVSGGIISFAAGDPGRPIHRGGGALVAAAAAHLVATRVGPDERILSLAAPHDLRGLVTGLVAALVSGAGLEMLPLFDGAAFATALARDVPTHLVVPGFLEANLVGRALPASLRSIGLAHRAPVRFPNRSRRPDQALRHDTVIDTVAFDETAIVSGRRGTGRDLALVLAAPERLGLPETVMAIRRDEEGRLAFRGQACASAPLQRGIPLAEPVQSWRTTPYAPMVSAGLATEIIAAARSGGDGMSAAFASA